MFRFFRKTRPEGQTDKLNAPPDPSENGKHPNLQEPTQESPSSNRQGWLERLGQGLHKTKSGLVEVFTGTRLDDDLYEELESTLILSDARPVEV